MECWGASKQLLVESLVSIRVTEARSVVEIKSCPYLKSKEAQFRIVLILSSNRINIVVDLSVSCDLAIPEMHWDRSAERWVPPVGNGFLFAILNSVFLYI